MTRVELREAANATYQLEVVLPAGLAGGRQTPRLPERCSFVGESIHQQMGVSSSLQFQFDCSPIPLTDRDTLSFPWPTAGTLLVATWQDGTSESQYFPRVGLLTEIAIAQLRSPSTSPLISMQTYLKLGIGHALGGGNHWLWLLGLCAVLRSQQRWRWVTAFGVGHLLAIGPAALGLLTLPMLPAEVCLALAVAFLARASLTGHRPDKSGLWLMFGLGFLHGLGLAGELTARGMGGSERLLGLLAFTIGLDAMSLLLLAAIAGIELLGRRVPRSRWGQLDLQRGLRLMRPVLLVGMGSAAIALTLSTATSDRLLGNIRQIESRQPDSLLDFRLRSGGTPVAAPPSENGADGKNPSLPDPLKSFVTIEPFEIRHEILVRLESLDVSVAASRDGVIPVEAQESLKQRIGTLLAEGTTLHIDGQETPPILDRIDFVTLGPSGTLVQEAPLPEPLDTAVVGVVLSYILSGLPQTVTVNWGDILPADRPIPVLAINPEGSNLTEVTADRPQFIWQNDLVDFQLPTVEAIAVTPPQLVMPLLSLGILAMAMVADRQLRRSPAAIGPLVAARIVLPAAILLYPLARVKLPLLVFSQPQPSADGAAILLDGLLANVYRSFEFRDEEVIYDKLATSVTGEQLTDIYLQNRRSLELENQGGAQARVEQLDIVNVRSVKASPDGGFDIEAEWTVGGSIVHFGHTHFRQNRYDATITIVAEEDSWKIQHIEAIDEERLL